MRFWNIIFNMKYIKICSLYFNYLNFLYIKIVILFSSLTKNDEYTGTKIKFSFFFSIYMAEHICKKLLCTCRTRFSCTTYTCADILKFMFLINPFIKRTLKKKTGNPCRIHCASIHNSLFTTTVWLPFCYSTKKKKN